MCPVGAISRASQGPHILALEVEAGTCLSILACILLTVRLRKIAYASYVGLSAVSLAVWLLPQTPKTRASVPTAALTTIAFFILAIISYQEHIRSERPPTWLTIYLGLSLLLDLARARTLFKTLEIHTLAVLFLVSYCIKFAVFTMEIVEKRRLLKPEWSCESYEATSSVYSRSLFVWLNPLFGRGFKSQLYQETLPPIDPAVLSTSNPSRLFEKWDHCNYCLLPGVLQY